MKKNKLTVVEGRAANQKMMSQVLRAGSERGWGVRIVKYINPVDIALGKLDGIFTENVWWRGFEKNSGYEAARVLEYVNENALSTINTHARGGLACTSNKYYQHGIMMLNPELREHIIPMFEVGSRERLENIIEAGALEFPFLLKPVFGTQGEGIIMIREPKDLDKVSDFTFMGAERYVKSEFDWRVFVLGGKALGVMRKIGNEKDETDFYAKSAGLKKFKEEDEGVFREVSELAVKAAEVSGLDYAGVDLIRDDETGQFYVVETNFAAGWQNGFKEATGVDIPAEIFEYFEEKISNYF